MTTTEPQGETAELQPVTEEQLLDELQHGQFRLLGQENPEDLNRIEAQLRDEVISPILLARYIGVRPQMIYQAIREGKLTTASTNNTQKKYIRLNEALRYAAKYLTRRQVRELEKLQEARIQEVIQRESA